jgi:hypothetical protein
MVGERVDQHFTADSHVAALVLPHSALKVSEV